MICFAIVDSYHLDASAWFGNICRIYRQQAITVNMNVIVHNFPFLHIGDTITQFIIQIMRLPFFQFYLFPHIAFEHMAIVIDIQNSKNHTCSQQDEHGCKTDP